MDHPTWKEIKDILISELKNTETILTWGTIGSCNPKTDIDLVITKKKNAKSSDFYKEIHFIFKNLREYFKKKYFLRVVSSSPGSLESKKKLFSKGDLKFDTMAYTTYNQLVKDWEWALFEDIIIKDFLRENYKCLFGNVENLFSKKIKKSCYGDPMFIYMTQQDYFFSGYKRKELVKKMNEFFDFVFRKRLKVRNPLANNVLECKKYFYRLCDVLDNLKSKRK